MLEMAPDQPLWPCSVPLTLLSGHVYHLVFLLGEVFLHPLALLSPPIPYPLSLAVYTLTNTANSEGLIQS